MLSKTNQKGLFYRITYQILIKHTTSLIRIIIYVQLRKSICLCLSLRLLLEMTEIICMLKLCFFFSWWEVLKYSYTEVLLSGIFQLSQKLRAIKGSSMIGIKWKSNGNGNQNRVGRKKWRRSSGIGKRREQHGQYFRLSTIHFRQSLSTAQTGLLKSRFGYQN